MGPNSDKIVNELHKKFSAKKLENLKNTFWAWKLKY